MSIKYSVVIPLKDEEENVELLVNELSPIMRGLGGSWELLCIDDGSSDKTIEKLRNLQIAHPELKILAFDKNYGQSSAFDAGFRHAQGEFIITMDGDLQNDPNDIPNLVTKAAGYDLVCGYRHNRKDPPLKKITSFFANKIRGKLCADHMKDTGCSLKVYRRNCLEKIKLFDGMHRFLPALFINEKFSVAEVPVNHRARKHGKTKYNFLNRSFNTIADMLAVRWMRRRSLHYKINRL